MSLPRKKGLYPSPNITNRDGASGVYAMAVAVCCCLPLLFSTTVWAADCPDNDGDGFVVCNDCDVPDGKQCGDCDDNRKDINPAAEEFCGDLVDNNCDGNIDFNTGEKCTIGFPDGCQDTGKTVGDLLPLDCEDIFVGQCSNDDSISCKTDADCGSGTCDENALKTAIARCACHAFKGNDCETLPLGQRLVCRATANKLAQVNISAGQPLLLCARQDVPPRLLIQDDGTTPAVENALRLNDLSVALIVDRDGNGQLDGELTATVKCLAEGAPTIGDCSFFGACLDLNIETAMQLASRSCEADPSIICTGNADCAFVGGACVDVCDSGKPGFVTRVLAIQPTIRTAGVVCGGATTPGDDDLLADTSGEDQTIDILLENATRFSPPACIEGLSLGGFVEFKNPRLIAIDADGDPTFDDYIGINGDIE